jgi:hypothetical protein
VWFGLVVALVPIRLSHTQPTQAPQSNSLHLTMVEASNRDVLQPPSWSLRASA